ncbi:membrane bound O-acyl transferase family-domain-containing protein [Xylaria sp. CBS 124048]|nr:membrane bound O-acyl transferase family-domain-containing protein [Xylaria sp. CBS 124048]
MSSSTFDFHELREPTGSPWPHYALMALHIGLLVGPDFRYRRTVAGVGTVVLMAVCWSNPNFTTDIGQAQPFSLTWSTYLATLEKLVLLPRGVSTERAFYRVHEPPERVSFAAFSLRKLLWAAALVFNMRGIGWNYQVKNVPSLSARSARSRLDFIATRFVAAAYFLFMIDLASHATVNIFYTNEQTLVAGDVDSKYLRIWDHRSLIWSFIRGLTFAVQPYYGIQLQYTVSSIIAVGLGISKPADWPPSFGKLSEATSLRKFWGTYWHQTLRRMFEAWTGAFRDMCGFKKGTLLSKYSQLWLSFFISGCGHAASILILPSPKHITMEERTVGLIVFFMWQAAIITLEDGMRWLWIEKVRGPSPRENFWVRWICYGWVVGQIWFSVGWAGDVFLRMRMAEQPLLPFTMTGGFVKEWVPVVRGYLVGK